MKQTKRSSYILPVILFALVLCGGTFSFFDVDFASTGELLLRRFSGTACWLTGVYGILYCFTNMFHKKVSGTNAED